MTISHFDSNGLIFALSESASQEKGELYKAAVRNIIEAQGFDVIPLVDGPRIRTNVNDMTARATYKKNGGSITHLAQRSGESVELFPIEQILKVPQEQSFFHSLNDLCSHVLKNPATPFVFIVVDSNDSPTALFSVRELLSNRLNEAILSTFLGFKGLMKGKVEEDSKAVHRLLELFQSLKEEHRAYWEQTNIESRDTDKMHSLCTKISQQLERFLKEKISSPRWRQSPPRMKNAEARLIDVMRHGAAGIIWNDEKLEQTQLACELLSKANDFSFLTIYNRDATLDQTHVVDKEGKRHKLAAGYQDPFKRLDASLKLLFQDEFPLFIKPSKSINTGEGHLIWPSILSFEEVKNHHGSHWLMTTISKLEETIRNLLPKRVYKLNNGQRTHRDRLGLGTINNLLKGKEKDSGDIKPMESEYVLPKSVIDWRNDFSHGLKKGSLRLAKLTRKDIARTVRCSELWGKMGPTHVRKDGQKDKHKGSIEKNSTSQNRSLKSTGTGKQGRKKTSQRNGLSWPIKIYHENNSNEADLRKREEVEDFYTQFDRIFENRPNIRISQLHECVWDGWFGKIGNRKPVINTLDVRAWIELYVKGEIDEDIFLNSFEKRRE